jgi:hypothetical protein
MLDLLREVVSICPIFSDRLAILIGFWGKSWFIAHQL